jgi:hypothetical protein
MKKDSTKFQPREKEKGISERGNNNARIERVLYETSGREKGKRKSRNRNEEKADDARGNRNHSRRGKEINKENEKKKGRGEVKVEEKEGKRFDPIKGYLRYMWQIWMKC